MKQIKRKEFILINTGLLLTAAGIVLFKAPNGFAIGGVSGIAIIVNRFLPGHNVGLLMLVINIALNAAGLFMLGKDFGIRTAYSSTALSFFVWAGEKLFRLSRPLTGDAMLELAFAVALPAVGSALVFNQNSSTGGTDIVAKILTRYTHLHVGKTLLIADFLIASSALFALGVRQGMYSILGLVLKGFIIDIVIESLNIRKKFEIVTNHPKEIETFIMEQMHRGITVIQAEGGFSGKRKTVLTVILNRTQAVRLRSYVRAADPGAFLIITNVSEIIGKGFRSESQDHA